MAALTRFESWTKEEVDILVAKTRADAKNPKIHVQFDLYVILSPYPHNLCYMVLLTSRTSYIVYGQKPEST
jgi:hypothetical protein